MKCKTRLYKHIIVTVKDEREKHPNMQTEPIINPLVLIKPMLAAFVDL